MVFKFNFIFILPESNQWLIIAITFFLLLFSYIIGYSIGKKNHTKKPANHLSSISALLAGLMALLGILLAFSFSMSSSRFDQRKQLIIDESLNIGTAYFRLGLLSDTSLTREVRNILKKYLDHRIKYYESGASEKLMNKQMKSAENLQVLVWMKTAEIGKTSPNINTSLISQSLNSMIDITGSISGSMRNHVPQLILLMLIAVSAFTIFTMGYSHGLALDYNIWFSLGINLIICSILLLIIDMDTPFIGPIKVDIYSLIDLKNEIERFDP